MVGFGLVTKVWRSVRGSKMVHRVVYQFLLGSWHGKYCRVWSNGISGIDCGDEAGAWMSQFLAIPGLRLVHHPLTFQGRQMREANTLTQLCWKETDKVSTVHCPPYPPQFCILCTQVSASLLVPNPVESRLLSPSASSFHKYLPLCGWKQGQPVKRQISERINYLTLTFERPL